MYLSRGFVLPTPSITKQSLNPPAEGGKIALPCLEVVIFLHTQRLVLTDLRNFQSFDQRANMLAAPPNGKSPRIIMSVESVHTRDPLSPPDGLCTASLGPVSRYGEFSFFLWISRILGAAGECYKSPGEFESIIKQRRKDSAD
jgi:hypothetical protein